MIARPCLPTLDRSAALADLEDLVERLEGALHASVAVDIDGDLVVVVSTDDSVDVALGCGGPTALTVATGAISRVPTVRRTDQFPDYVIRCGTVGVSSVAAFPLKVGEHTLGALTVTSQDHHGFGPLDVRESRTLASAIATRLWAELSRAMPNIADADSDAEIAEDEKVIDDLDVRMAHITDAIATT